MLMADIRSIAVIGAGAAGLVAAMVLIEKKFHVTIFEQSHDVGGVWNYHPGSSAMYESLRTNLPKEIMAFNKENPIINVSSSFPTHYEIEAYLRSFAEKHNLHQLIKFGHKIVKVSKLEVPDDVGNIRKCQSWCLEWERIPQQDETTHRNANTSGSNSFDAVIVCNGHFSVPFMPVVPTLSNFRGISVHSNQYDRVKPSLQGKVVLIVGTASSGNDIAKELLAIAGTVHISDRNYNVSGGSSCDYSHTTLPTNMHVHAAVLEISPDGTIIFADDSMVSNIDVIIWCTGYLYDFPFLAANGAPHEYTPISPLSAPSAPSAIPAIANTTSTSMAEQMSVLVQAEEGKRVRPLYQQLFAIGDPTLVFLGLPFRVVPFPLFYLQAEYVAAVFTGRAQLPSVPEQYAWLAAFEEQLAHNNLYNEKYHFLGGDPQWAYCRHLATASGLMKPSNSRESMDDIDYRGAIPYPTAHEPNSVGNSEYITTSACSSSSSGCIASATSDTSMGSSDASKECSDMQDMSRYIDLLEEIYNDNMQHRPMYPGDSDSFRNRRYKVNWGDYTWTVE